MSQFSFYKADKAYGELYLQFPRVLLYSDKYSHLSESAKIAYMIFKDRLQYSLKNNWIDEDGNVYFIYEVEELCKLLNKSKPTVIKIKKELEKAGLLLQKQMGFDPQTKKNKPNRLYLADLEVNATDIYQLQEAENHDTSGSKNSLPREEEVKSLGTSGSKNSLPREKRPKTLDTSGSKNSLPNLYLNTYLNNKDNKDNKESYESQNNTIENSFNANKGNYETEKELIDQYIEDKQIKQQYGERIVSNFKKYSHGNFDTFQLFYEKLYYAHRSAEKEVGITFLLDSYFTDRADVFKRELSKTFWRVVQAARAGKVKKDVNNLLFASFKNELVSIAQAIKAEQDNRNKPNIPLIDPFEQDNDKK